MKVVMVLGADGYLGWPLSLRLLEQGYEVVLVDSMVKRLTMSRQGVKPLFPTAHLPARGQMFQGSPYRQRVFVEMAAVDRYEEVDRLFAAYVPDAVVHLAEMPSAPYSMMGRKEAQHTLMGNVQSTFNVVWGCLNHNPDCELLKLGTMGEYGTPNIPITEGYVDLRMGGKKDTFLYPRAAASLYHTSKIMDTDLLDFYARVYGLRVTDLMQGPVYGMGTRETQNTGYGTMFYYDAVFGTVINRFVVQAVFGIPLTIYGSGGQTRGYISLDNALDCMLLALRNPPAPGRMRIMNQITECFSIRDLAKRVAAAGTLLDLEVFSQHLDNPRQEKEEHPYEVDHTKLLDLGLVPQPLSVEMLAGMMEKVVQRGSKGVDMHQIIPRVSWRRA